MENFIKQYKIGFVYKLQCVDKKTGKVKWEEVIENLIPTPGINYIVGAALNGTAQLSTWYIGLSESTYTPLSTDTMSTLMTGIGGAECQKYTQGARVQLVPDVIASGLYSNAGTPAEFDFNASATVRLGFLASAQTWDESSSTLISAVVFSTPRTLGSGDTLRVTAGIQLVAA